MSNDKELEDLHKLYPSGSKEREILDYSMGKELKSDVNPIFFLVFKTFMISAILVTLFIVFSYISG